MKFMHNLIIFIFREGKTRNIIIFLTSIFNIVEHSITVRDLTENQ